MPQCQLHTFTQCFSVCSEPQYQSPRNRTETAESARATQKQMMCQQKQLMLFVTVHSVSSCLVHKPQLASDQLRGRANSLIDQDKSTVRVMKAKTRISSIQTFQMMILLIRSARLRTTNVDLCLLLKSAHSSISMAARGCTTHRLRYE